MKKIEVSGMDALKIAGVLAAGIAAYLIVSRVIKAGEDAATAVGDAVGSVVTGTKEIITEDLNPSSSKNIISRNLPDDIKSGIGDFLGWVFDHENYVKYKAATENGGHSNLQMQKVTAAPPKKVNPLGHVETVLIPGVGELPINFRKKP